MAASATTARYSLNLFTKAQLRDGNLFPIFGLGTWRAEKTDCKNAAIHAVNLGYRLLDTASCYENEQEVGQAVKQCGVPRDELFITGKLWTPDHGTMATKTAFNQSLKKSIGVSNFNIHHLEKLIAARPYNIPAVNQIEISPFLTRDELVEYCKSKNISVQAFSPLMKGKYLQDPDLIKMASKYNKTVAQLLIRWSLQHGYTCIPKSITPSRIEENSKVFDFIISETDMLIMNGWNRNIVTDWNVIDSEWID